MLSEKDFNRHPCFNAKAKGHYGRVHLPVAPRCNIQCNYCNRKYDCVNESRPGVTSTLLSPQQALVYMEKVLEKEPRISVAGIAGPGDPFANAPEVLETMRLIRARFPEMILCLSSNGLAVEPHVAALAEIGVSHVTITINAVDPEISSKMYAWVRDDGMVYTGMAAAQLLLDRQIAAVKALKKHNITVKVNTIVTAGINDHHVPAVARRMQELGVDLLNCMAMFPNADTPFADIVELDNRAMKKIRDQAETYLPQMRHCARCRADAVGLLGDDKSQEFHGCLSACAQISPDKVAEPQTNEVLLPVPDVRPYVAVATLEGMLVNQHLGEALSLQIWGEDGNGGFLHIENRATPTPGENGNRWQNMSKLLADCRAVLVNDLGASPREILLANGIEPITISGFIARGLEAVFKGEDVAALQGRTRKCRSKGACVGSGDGCG